MRKCGVTSAMQLWRFLWRLVWGRFGDSPIGSFKSFQILDRRRRRNEATGGSSPLQTFTSRPHSDFVSSHLRYQYLVGMILRVRMHCRRRTSYCTVDQYIRSSIFDRPNFGTELQAALKPSMHASTPADIGFGVGDYGQDEHIEANLASLAPIRLP